MMMKKSCRNIDAFKRRVGKKKDVLSFLLSYAGKLLGAREAGLIFGTDASENRFLPPAQWDRGLIDRFHSKGIRGIFLKFAGPFLMKRLGLSPIWLFKRDNLGEVFPAAGITAYALRNHQEFYDRGIKLLLVDRAGSTGADTFSMASFDGKRFKDLNDIRADTKIVKRFQARNFLVAYIPDYGAIVFNTVQAEELAGPDGRFIYGASLISRLEDLILAIEQASLAYLGRARGTCAAKLIIRKEARLRKTAAALARKEAEIREKEAHLFSIGAVTTEQLSMAAVQVPEGVYSFVDMAGSVGVRRKLLVREYFGVLNLCHEIAADNALRFGCRVDNIMGDSVFFESLPLFDRREGGDQAEMDRLMRMTCLLSSMLGEIYDLSCGRHPMDRDRRVASLLKPHGLTLGFRAGMTRGCSLVGPLGNRKRKIITAIGETVDRASRLESSGQVHHIHVMLKTAFLLKEAWVSEDTPLIFNLAKKVMAGQMNGRSGVPFMEFYSHWRALEKNCIKERHDACHKEFFGKKTCLIPCVPDRFVPNVCSGI